jgi:hypothetical protein
VGGLFAQNAVVLRGQVLDELGAVVPGAKVTIISTDGKPRSVLSDGNGEFTVHDLLPGAYTLTVEFQGFQPHIENDLRLPLAISTLKITLKIAAVSIETDVKAEAAGVSVEPDQNPDALVLDEDFIETLPDNEEDLREYLEMMAGPGAGGARGGQGRAQFLVDGFRGGRLPPREAILQIRINQNPFSAEYSHPGAGRVEIITKPGNNNWRGGAGLGLFNSALNARNAFAVVKPGLDQKRYSFNLSGPIIRKKMSFFANVERRGLDGSGTVRAQTLEGLFIANVPAPNESSSLSLRTDYLINQKNTFNFSYSRQSSSSRNREFLSRGGVSNFILPERGSDLESTNHTMRLGEVFLINSSLIHETRLQLQHNRRELRALTQGRAINVLDAFQGGGATCCPNRAREFSAEWQDYLTYTRRKHTVKGGIQIEYNSRRDFNASNFNGAYIFSSLDQYRRVLNGERVDPTNPESALARPAQFTINQGDPLIEYNRYEASWFIQDDVRVNQALTLSFGLRHEFQSQLTDAINFAPRLGVAWSPFKDRKTVIRAGGGIFFDRLTANLYDNVLRYDGLRQRSIIIRNPSYPDPFADNPVIDVQRMIKRTLDPNLKAPYVIDFNISVERQLPSGFVSSISYTWTKGVHQFRARNINAPLPETNARPDPAQGNLYQTEASAQSKHQRLWFRLDRRFSRTFSLFSSYTLSRTDSDADSPLALPANNYYLRPEWSRAATDRRHFIYLGGNATLPWRIRLTPYVNIASGLPFNITTGFDENRDTVINDRPLDIRRNADLSASLYSQLPDRCLSGCKIGGTPVSLRDFLTTNFPNGVWAEGPGLFNFNLSLSKSFGFGENRGAASRDNKQSRVARNEASGGRVGKRESKGAGKIASGKGSNAAGSVEREASRFNFTISAQITNLLNHVNFGQYSGVLTSPFFGRANSAGPPRQIEINLRFNF